MNDGMKGHPGGRRERWRESLKLALDVVRAHRLRSALLILGVAIGVATLMGIVSILRGLGAKIQADISSSDRMVITVARFDFVTESPEEESIQKRTHLKPEDADFLAENCALVNKVCFYIEPAGRMTVVRYQGRRTNLISVVGGAAEMAYVYSIPLAEGRLFTREEILHRRHVALLGYGPAHDLFPHEDPLGRRIRIEGEEYEIAGIFGERQNIFGSLAENYIVIPYTTFLKEMAQQEDERYLLMTVKPGAPLDEATREVEQLVRMRRRVPAGKPNDFSVISSDAISGLVDRITQPIGLALAVISSVGLMVGGIGVMNIMLVSVTERTREIGVRKALGATRGDILTQFLIEAASLTAAGGIIGIAGGLLLAWGIRRATGFPMSVSPFFIVLAVAVSAGIGIGFGLWPANRAARQDPIVALHYE